MTSDWVLIAGIAAWLTDRLATLAVRARQARRREARAAAKETGP